MNSLNHINQMVRVILSRLNLVKLAFALIAIASFFSAIAVTVTSQTGFCSSCHIMEDYYTAWEKSEHSEISCLSCHLRPGFTSYLKGKINGLAQAVDCIVGRVGTKAEATVQDSSCLRSACHSRETLLSDAVSFESVKFTHKGHADESLDGISITCGTCHSHTQGQDHFSVDTNICYTCHFVRSGPGSDGLVQSQCVDCHDIPQQTIDMGLVTVDHQAFVSYNVNCENSCHQRQIEHLSNVPQTTCLHCHTFGMNDEDTSEQLHAYHSEGEKVECFACHGTIGHGPDKNNLTAAMNDCESCHSDTHSVQKTIFSSNQQTHEAIQNKKILSPMFLTHVECTGCHIEKHPSRDGMPNSMGAVARATPQACDTCHEAGTGQRYIPFWQTSIKELYQQVVERVDSLSLKVNAFDDQTLKVHMQKLDQARLILRSVEADGSWGVHNLKYTESLLLQAKQLANEVEPVIK